MSPPIPQSPTAATSEAAAPSPLSRTEGLGWRTCRYMHFVEHQGNVAAAEAEEMQREFTEMRRAR